MTDTPNTNTSEKDPITLEQLLNDYRDIHLMLNAQWPIESKNERIHARFLKLVEEQGELANEILTKMGLQRQAKVDAFEDVHVEDEFADVLGSLILLAIELDLDIPEIIRRKIGFTIDRLQQEIEQGEA